MTTFVTSVRSGMSYMTSSSASSTIVRRARAPVLRSRASFAVASSASGVKTSSTLSRLRNLVNCRVTAFFGSVRTLHQVLLVERGQADDHRQAADELGDQPVLEQVLRHQLVEQVRGAARPSTAAPDDPKPMPRLPTRSSMIFSRPSNAPPQMNRMFVVSIWMKSWCGCLRPPCGGTLATVPSRIFSSACWTPSPETSRVMRGVVGLARDLVDLVDVDDPALGALRRRSRRPG